MDKPLDIITPTDDGASLHASGGWYAQQLREWSCGHCHTCGHVLNKVGFCTECKETRRYSVHGYIGDDHDSTPCNTTTKKQNETGH